MDDKVERIESPLELARVQHQSKKVWVQTFLAAFAVTAILVFFP